MNQWEAIVCSIFICKYKKLGEVNFPKQRFKISGGVFRKDNRIQENWVLLILKVNQKNLRDRNSRPLDFNLTFSQVQLREAVFPDA